MRFKPMVPFKNIHCPLLSVDFYWAIERCSFQSQDSAWLIVTPLCVAFSFKEEPAKGLQEGASGLQQMSWATSYKLEKESNPPRLITGRGHTRSCAMSLWDGEKATASYWISRDRAWNLRVLTTCFHTARAMPPAQGGHKLCCLGQAAEVKGDNDIAQPPSEDVSWRSCPPKARLPQHRGLCTCLPIYTGAR